MTAEGAEDWPSPEAVDELFESLDLNRDGVLDRREFDRALDQGAIVPGRSGSPARPADLDETHRRELVLWELWAALDRQPAGLRQPALSRAFPARLARGLADWPGGAEFVRTVADELSALGRGEFGAVADELWRAIEPPSTPPASPAMTAQQVFDRLDVNGDGRPLEIGGGG